MSINEPKNAKAFLPTKFGDFNVVAYSAKRGHETLVLTSKNFDPDNSPLVRVHSECMTGDVFGSLRCDCGPQRDSAMDLISRDGNGVFIYLRQEGRGIGLFNKIRAYSLMEKGVDTHQASIELGLEPDGREYSAAIKALKDLGITKMRLLTNNPSKFSEVFRAGIEVERVPLLIEPNTHNHDYFKTKDSKFNHLLTKQEQSYNFYGFTFMDPDTDISELVAQLDEVRLPSHSMIHAGLHIDSTYLENPKLQSYIQKNIDICLASNRTIPTIHLTVPKPGKTKNAIQKAKEVFNKIEVVQLNHLEQDIVEALREAARHFKEVIIPLHNSNLDIIKDKDFRKAFEEIQPFILLDNSQGQGVQESEKVLRTKIQACLNQGINRIALAGGFGPDSLESYFSAKNYFKIDFSVDAESQLHTSGKLDGRKVLEYIQKLAA